VRIWIKWNLWILSSQSTVLVFLSNKQELYLQYALFSIHQNWRKRAKRKSLGKDFLKKELRKCIEWNGERAKNKFFPKKSLIELQNSIHLIRDAETIPNPPKWLKASVDDFLGVFSHLREGIFLKLFQERKLIKLSKMAIFRKKEHFIMTLWGFNPSGHLKAYRISDPFFVNFAILKKRKSA